MEVSKGDGWLLSHLKKQGLISLQLWEPRCEIGSRLHYYSTSSAIVSALVLPNGGRHFFQHSFHTQTLLLSQLDDSFCSPENRQDRQSDEIPHTVRHFQFTGLEMMWLSRRGDPELKSLDFTFIYWHKPHFASWFLLTVKYLEGRETEERSVAQDWQTGRKTWK